VETKKIMLPDGPSPADRLLAIGDFYTAPYFNQVASLSPVRD
jgi:hypothetical protein